MHTMKSPLPSSMRAGGPPGTRPWRCTPPAKPVPSACHCRHPNTIAARGDKSEPALSTLNRAIQRRSYAIASLQQKLDAQRADNLDLQTKYKTLHLTLVTLLDMWHEIKRAPAVVIQCEQTSQFPGRNATHLPEQQPQPAASEDYLPINNQPCPCPSSPQELLAEHHPPISIQSPVCPTSPHELVAGHHPFINQSIDAATPTSPLVPASPRPTASPQQFRATSPVGSVQENTHPAIQQPSVLPPSPARQRFRKKDKRKSKHVINQRMPHLDTWFEGFSSLPVKPLCHGPIWEAPESAVVYHTCAPPPGWKTVNGITVPPSPMPIADTQPATAREDGDDDLGVWFCTKCYLDPMEKPPDFEMCSSCAENYYFPYPPTLTRDWVCQGCFDLCKGKSSAYRQCYCCGRTEEFTM